MAVPTAKAKRQKRWYERHAETLRRKRKARYRAKVLGGGLTQRVTTECN
jgi:hypothetical protein